MSKCFNKDCEFYLVKEENSCLKFKDQFQCANLEVKVRITLFELEECKKFINKINNEDLHNIELYDEHTGLIEFTYKEIEEWKFTGLNNIDFLYKKADID